MVLVSLSCSQGSGFVVVGLPNRGLLWLGCLFCVAGIGRVVVISRACQASNVCFLSPHHSLVPLARPTVVQSMFNSI